MGTVPEITLARQDPSSFDDEDERMEEPFDLSNVVPKKVCRREMMCEACNEVQSKYTCPKCAFRSCSVDCVKQHKEERKCDGIPQHYTAIAKFSEFKPSTSIRDQDFLDTVKAKLPTEQPQESEKESEKSPVKEQRLPQKQYTPVVYHLLQNCRLRRIWLSFKEEHETSGSRHEGFSDTIFWTIKLNFVKTPKFVPNPALENKESGSEVKVESAVPVLPGQLSTEVKTESVEEANKEECEVEDGELSDEEEKPEEVEVKEEQISEPVNVPVEESNDDFVIDVKAEPVETEELESYSYTVSNIPESLTLKTLIRQFSKPKVYGPVVSRSDLEMDKMETFLGAPEDLMVFMVLQLEYSVKHYPLDQGKTIVENLKNKFINGHPELVVIHGQDPHLFVEPSSEELEKLHQERREKYQGDNKETRRPRNNFNNNRRGNNNRNNNSRPPNNQRPYQDQRSPQGNQRPPFNRNQNRVNKRQYHQRDDALENILLKSHINQNDVAAMNKI